MGLLLGCLFCSISLCVCFCANTILVFLFCFWLSQVLAAAHVIFHCGRQALHYGTQESLVVVRGLSSPAAMWDFNSSTRDWIHVPALEGRFLNTVPPGKSPTPYCFDYCSFVVQFAIRKHDAFSFVLHSQDRFDSTCFLREDSSHINKLLTNLNASFLC